MRGHTFRVGAWTSDDFAAPPIVPPPVETVRACSSSLRADTAASRLACEPTPRRGSAESVCALSGTRRSTAGSDAFALSPIGVFDSSPTAARRASAISFADWNRPATRASCLREPRVEGGRKRPQRRRHGERLGADDDHDVADGAPLERQRPQMHSNAMIASDHRLLRQSTPSPRTCSGLM